MRIDRVANHVRCCRGYRLAAEESQDIYQLILGAKFLETDGDSYGNNLQEAKE